jgi:hypothetical protein
MINRAGGGFMNQNVVSERNLRNPAEALDHQGPVFGQFGAVQTIRSQNKAEGILSSVFYACTLSESFAWPR